MADIAKPVRREYLKRGPAPEVGLLNQPGVTEAIKKYFSSKEILKRGFYPVGTPPEEQRRDEPGVGPMAMTPGGLRKALGSFFKARTEHFKKAGLRGAEKFSEAAIGREAARASDVASKMTPKMVKRLQKLTTKAPEGIDADYLAAYLYPPGYEKPTIYMHPGMAREPSNVLAHESLGHLGYDTFIRSAPKGSRRAVLHQKIGAPKDEMYDLYGDLQFMLFAGTHENEVVERLARMTYKNIPEEVLSYSVENQIGRGVAFPTAFFRGVKRAEKAAEKAPKLMKRVRDKMDKILAGDLELKEWMGQRRSK